MPVHTYFTTGYRQYRGLSSPIGSLCAAVPLIRAEKAIVYDQCGAQFQTEESLEAHRQIHTGSDMAIFCLLCGKRFQTQTALQQHMEVHAGVRSYICSECNRTFPSHTALKRHLRSHTDGEDTTAYADAPPTRRAKYHLNPSLNADETLRPRATEPHPLG
ncbi:zinc finger and BTB domain-containing protein 16 isoform X1, partial [Lates japonicus]